ncbi:LysR family transcriptional regulator [Photobacterium sp. BZF1]|uniref:LysR family transcriptional regulator n=1 Tax=Photobacterium sp. BZF1 TaxID=1904457 RepID=UPI0016535194|nr:LysR family transcriptional regulator [Photobacterium sp. BZF1]MBC7006141.1 LysR family transcriptional regulator [Photobacterium sp. BZF1]
MQYSLEQLQTFITAYELNSFQKAAIKLNKHRTTVGQVITSLEIQWGVTLFDRSARSVQITEEGKLLYHYAKQTLEQAKSLDKIALSLAENGLETVTIAYGSFVPHAIVLSMYQTLSENFPSVRINLEICSKKEAKQGIENGSIHFALMNVHQSQMIHSFDSTLLGHLSLIPVAGKQHAVHTVEDKDRYSTMRSSKQLIIQSFIEDDLATRIIISSQHDQVADMTLLAKLISDGEGWSLLPQHSLEEPMCHNQITKIELPAALSDMVVPVALWCPHSVNIAPIKNKLIQSISPYFS